MASAPISLPASQNFWIDDGKLSRILSKRVPAEIADLVDIAMEAYARDRLQARVKKRGRHPEPRKIDICLGVRRPDIWTDHSVRDQLSAFLWWLTEDDWSFSFTQASGTTQRDSERQRLLFDAFLERPVRVALFSGGLDSLAGAATLVEPPGTGTIVLVSGYTNNRLRTLQRNLAQSLPRTTHITVDYGLKNPREARERSQRSRGFVFLSLGIGAAFMAQADRLEVFENGVGAINLPLAENQIGVDNSRGVHPRTIAEAGKLFDRVLDQEITIENPFLYLTKGEVCARLTRAGLGRLAAESISCDGFPRRIRRHRHCGTCTSCLLRRLGMSAAGLEEDDAGNDYEYDLIGHRSLVPAARMVAYDAMEYQIERLSRCVEAPDPWYALTQQFPDLEEAAHAASSYDGGYQRAREGIIRMYRRYVSEWMASRSHR